MYGIICVISHKLHIMERTLFTFLRSSVLTCYDYDLLILDGLLRLCRDNLEIDKHQYSTLKGLLITRAEQELDVSRFTTYIQITSHE